jgi:hypothetical protein
MKTRILYFSQFFFIISAISFSQTSESSLISGGKKDSVVNITSAWQPASIVNPVTIGTEISGFYYNEDYSLVETYGVSVAFYTGHSFSFKKMIRSFAESSPLNYTFNEKPMDYKYSNTFIFFAPGISFYSINRKYSLDLYKKPETRIYNNGKQQIQPLKVNFHF